MVKGRSIRVRYGNAMTRGICPECKHYRPVLKDGTMRKHKAWLYSATELYGQPGMATAERVCPGSGQPKVDKGQA